MCRYFLLLLALVSAVAGSARAVDGWTQMKAGMTPEETAAALGTPLLRTANRGFQLWVYSDRAEVVFYKGPVVAWTAPTPNPVAALKPVSADVSVLPGGILLRSAPVGPRSVLERAYASFPETSFRYSQRPFFPR